MHPYGTDSSERFWVLIGLVPLSFWLAAGARGLLDRVGIAWPIEAEFIADPTSAAFCLGVLYYVFNRWLWRVPLLHALDLVKVPNLNGAWAGELRSSYDDYQTGYAATLEIRQNWTTMSICLRRDQSRSHSEAATILTNAGGGPRLSYEYVNEPIAGRVEGTMAMHRGAAALVLEQRQGIVRLDGQYYTSHGRSNVGRMEFQRCGPGEEI